MNFSAGIGMKIARYSHLEAKRVAIVGTRWAEPFRRWNTAIFRQAGLKKLDFDFFNAKQAGRLAEDLSRIDLLFCDFNIPYIRNQDIAGMLDASYAQGNLPGVRLLITQGIRKARVNCLLRDCIKQTARPFFQGNIEYFDHHLPLEWLEYLDNAAGSAWARPYCKAAFSAEALSSFLPIYLLMETLKTSSAVNRARVFSGYRAACACRRHGSILLRLCKQLNSCAGCPEVGLTKQLGLRWDSGRLAFCPDEKNPLARFLAVLDQPRSQVAELLGFHWPGRMGIDFMMWYRRLSDLFEAA